MGSIVWVEGIIGAGKSTLTTQLAEALNMKQILEPVEDNPYLKLFYMNQKRWAFSMQMELLFRRWGLHHEAMKASEEGNGAILDRGMPGDCVFAELHHEAGNISDIEWRTYQLMYETLVRTRAPTIPSVLVYLDVKPEVALERVTARNRGAETDLPLDYLYALQRGYESLLVRLADGSNKWGHGVAVLRVPWNSDKFPYEPIVHTVSSVLNA